MLAGIFIRFYRRACAWSSI